MDFYLFEGSLTCTRSRTEQNRTIQLKLRPRTGGVRAHNTNRQIATKKYLQEIHNKNCLQELAVALWSKNIIEPPHDKTRKMTVRPAKTQISLGIRPVWSGSSLCAQRVALWPKLSSCGQRRFWSDWVDVQANLSLRWAHMPFCWFCHELAYITLIFWLWTIMVETNAGVSSSLLKYAFQKVFYRLLYSALCTPTIGTSRSYLNPRVVHTFRRDLVTVSNNVYGLSLPTADSSRAVASYLTKYGHLGQSMGNLGQSMGTKYLLGGKMYVPRVSSWLNPFVVHCT